MTTTGDLASERADAAPLRTVLEVRAVAVCAIAVAVGGGTLAMIEPVLSLFLASAIDLGPARIGLVFGGGAVVATVLHPVFGRVADRVGGRQLTLGGLAAIGVALRSRPRSRASDPPSRSTLLRPWRSRCS